MYKKVMVFLLLFLLIAVVGMLMERNKDVDIKENVIPVDKEKPSAVESLVKQIFELAEQGKMLGIPFVAGQTDMKEVQELWGSAEDTSEMIDAVYATYTSRTATIGFRFKQVFDIRSNDSTLEQIRLMDIEQLKGKPDEIRSYQDAQVSQTILVYNVTPTIQLKWILPKPTEDEENPSVDHISIVTDVVAEEHPMISEMTLEEKVGQMIFAGIEGTIVSNETKEIISTQKVGGIILYQDNLDNAKQAVALVNSMKEVSKQEKFPLFIGVDQEGGRISRLPELQKLPTSGKIGQQNDPALAYNIGTLLGKELKAFGFNLDFAPVLDVNSNPKNPVIGNRSFGNSSEIVSSLGIQTMKGIQSENIISVVKHFPGHGDTDVDSHLELPVISKSLEDLSNLELIPFKNAMEDGADVVMIAHILLPKIDPNFPSSMSHEVITGILREQLQFEGVVITDDMTMNAILGNYTIEQAAVGAVRAGNDIVLVAHEYTNVVIAIDAIVQAVKNGEIPEERINESVNRLLLLKEKYKLNNEEIKEVNVQQLNDSIKQVLSK
ncbi:beta-N-acetylhexosaminidase [Psychrobacillus sp.]|uniref:beta-N-acetylhexosaminidase n=1 Tax=Psychrobacillus sp. TaxID=1871623 RepID=UPI0028BEE07D|nr:beta-N-acetylhexosaminidase [Psychrobacillus sp.]